MPFQRFLWRELPPFIFIFFTAGCSHELLGDGDSNVEVGAWVGGRIPGNENVSVKGNQLEYIPPLLASLSLLFSCLPVHNCTLLSTASWYWKRKKDRERCRENDSLFIEREQTCRKDHSHRVLLKGGGSSSWYAQCEYLSISVTWKLWRFYTKYKHACRHINVHSYIYTFRHMHTVTNTYKHINTTCQLPAHKSETSGCMLQMSCMQ